MKKITFIILFILTIIQVFPQATPKSSNKSNSNSNKKKATDNSNSISEIDKLYNKYKNTDSIKLTNVFGELMGKVKIIYNSDNAYYRQTRRNSK